MTIDYTDKIADIEEKIEQLKNRQRGLAQKYKAEKRKARTKRLIERGAILESLIEHADEMTNDEIMSLLEKALRGQGYIRKVPETEPIVAEQDRGKSSVDTRETE